MCNAIKLLLILFVCCFEQLQAVIVGSNTAVSIQGTTSFPTSGNANNEMRGFAYFINGFTLASSATTCLFNSYFPVGGVVDMRGGQLRLARDFMLSQTASFMSTGTFTGNGFSLKFPTDTSPFNFPVTTVSSSLNLITSINEAHVVNSVDWAPNDAFVAAGVNGGGVAVGTDNVYANSFNGLTLTAAGSTGGGIALTASQNVNSLRWHPSLNYMAVANAGLSLGLSDILVYRYTTGTGVFTQTGSGPLLSLSATALDWHPQGGFLAVAVSDNTVRSFTFNTVSGAITALNTYTNASITAPNNSLDWSADGNYVAVGSSNGTTQLFILNFNSITGLSLNTTAAPGNTANAVAWSPLGGYLAVGLSGGANTVRIYQFNGTTLTDITASHLGETKAVLSVDWSPDGSHVVYGFATGTGTELRTYNFNYTTGVLTLDGAVDTGASSLNSVRWSHNGQYIAAGDSANVVSIYNVSLALPFAFSNLKLILNSNVTSNASLLFTGSCEIEGNGYILDLSNISNLTIGAAGILSLKNMTIKGISGTKINFSDTAGILRLRDINWIQSGAYTFANGAFTIDGEVMFTGTSNFIYSSSKTSTIQSNAMLMFDSGMTFSYAPTTNTRSLLAMIDQTSKLYLLNTSLFSSNTGLQLTKGSLFIDGTCIMSSNATSQTQAISLGDGASSANNLTIKVMPESGITINSGFLVYNNI